MTRGHGRIFRFSRKLDRTTMADSSDEYEPEEGSTESPNTRNLRRRKAKDDAQVSGENSDKKKPKTGTSYRLSLPTDLRAIATMENHISRQLRGLDIDKNVSLRAIRAALREQKRYLLAKRKVGKAKAGSVPPAGVRDTVCNLFSISSPTYTKIIGNYMRNRSVYKSGADDHGRSGNKTAKDQRIPPAKAVQLKVRTFVREQRKSRKRVTGRQVTEIVRLAEEHGHEVLFTPPYHSDLQPIELLWARVKGRVGRQYNNETTLQIVYERLMREFQLVEESGHEAVQKYIDKCTGVAEKMYQEMDDDDDDDDDDGESSGDDTDARDNGEEDEEDDAGDFGDALFDDVGVRAEI